MSLCGCWTATKFELRAFDVTSFKFPTAASLTSNTVSDGPEHDGLAKKNDLIATRL